MASPNTKIADTLFFWLTILGTLFALIMHCGIYKTNIPDNKWTKVSKYIDKNYRKGDAVAVWPTWALKGSEKIQKESIFYSYNLSPERVRMFRRLWLVVAPYLGKWWFKRAFTKEIEYLKKLYWLKEKKKFGQLELYLFKLPPSKPDLFRFATRSSLRKAEVGLEAISSKGCPKYYPGYRFWLTRWIERPGWWTSPFDQFFWRIQNKKIDGPKLHQFFVGKIALEIGDEPHTCIWVPTYRCYRTIIRFRNVPLKGYLTLTYGIGTPAPAKVLPTIPPNVSAITLSLFAENRFINSWTAYQNRWKKSKLPIYSQKNSDKSDSKGSLIFKIESSIPQKSSVGFCFSGYIRED